MALEKQEISINLAQSVNDKVDDKIAGPDQVTVLQNARFDKDKRLVKRYGLTAQGTAITYPVPAFPNPLAITATNLRSKEMEHENQLLLQNNGVLYSKILGQNKWDFKGHYLPVEVTTNAIDPAINFYDSATVNGVTVSAGRDPLANQIVIYTTEEATGNLIAKTNAQNTLSAGDNLALKVIGFTAAGRVWVLYTATAGTNLKAVEVNLTDGSLGAPVTLKTNFQQMLSYKSGFQPAVTYLSALSPIGEAVLIAYYPTNAPFNIRVFPMLPNGTIPALGELNTGIAVAGLAAVQIYCEPSINANKFYLAYGAATVSLASWTFTAGAYAAAFAPLVIDASAVQVVHIGMAINPINNTELYVFYDSFNTNTALQRGGILYGMNAKQLNLGGISSQAYQTLSTTVPSWDNTLFYTVTSLNGVVSSAHNIIGYGYFLAANPIRDTIRKTIYLACATFSQLQSTVIGLDVLKGQYTPGVSAAICSTIPNYLFMKTLYSKAITRDPSNSNQFFPAYFYQLAQWNVTGASGVYRFINNGYQVDTNFTPQIASQSQYFAKTTHMTGGFLWSYDGNKLAEHNFFFSPEEVEVSSALTWALATTVQGGNAGQPEIYSFTVQDAQLIQVTTGLAQKYLQFNSVTTGYYAYFVKAIAGGSDPAIGGRTGIAVNIDDNDGAAEVALKLGVAIAAAVPGINAPAYTLNTGSSVVTLTNNANGNVTDAAVVNGGTAGSLSAGSYQYVIVWRWQDRNGNVYRSAPSIAKTVTALAASPAGIVFSCPPITNKQKPGQTNPFEDIYAEIYRTAANGTTFNLVTSVQWTGRSRLGYFDTASDTSIASNRILYTSGGVLENYNIPACRSVSFYKNRLIVSGFDDSTLVNYSKTNVINEPVNFSAFNFLPMNQDNLPVTGQAQMDDKLIVFKNRQVYVLSGDGSNDLGTNSTFQAPLLVAGDVGCVNNNSIVLYPGGLIFDSNKGIYNIDRSLGVNYVGSPVESFNANTISQGTLLKDINEIRFTLQDSTTALIYNYFFNRWDFFTNHQSDSSTLWQGQWTRVDNSGKVWIETTNYFDVDGSNIPISIYLESVWLKVKNIQDFSRIYDLIFLGEYKSPHTLTFNISYDYDPVVANSQNYVFDATTIIGAAGTAPGDQTYQFKVSLARQKCQSLKFKITETPGVGTQQSLILNDVGASVGVKAGLNKVKAEKSI